MALIWCDVGIDWGSDEGAGFGWYEERLWSGSLLWFPGKSLHCFFLSSTFKLQKENKFHLIYFAYSCFQTSPNSIRFSWSCRLSLYHATVQQRVWEERVLCFPPPPPKSPNLSTVLFIAQRWPNYRTYVALSQGLCTSAEPLQRQPSINKGNFIMDGATVPKGSSDLASP